MKGKTVTILLGLIIFTGGCGNNADASSYSAAIADTEMFSDAGIENTTDISNEATTEADNSSAEEAIDISVGAYDKLIADMIEYFHTRKIDCGEDYVDGFCVGDMYNSFDPENENEDDIPGYLIRDIDGNGTDELIFGMNDLEYDTWDGIVYQIFTMDNGKVVQLASGGGRSMYYLCTNGMIANEGASSAFETVYEFCRLDGCELVPEVIYYSDSTGWYKSNTKIDGDDAVPIDEDEVETEVSKYEYERPKFTPFIQ